MNIPAGICTVGQKFILENLTKTFSRGSMFVPAKCRPYHQWPILEVSWMPSFSFLSNIALIYLKTTGTDHIKFLLIITTTDFQSPIHDMCFSANRTRMVLWLCSIQGWEARLLYLSLLSAFKICWTFWWTLVDIIEVLSCWYLKPLNYVLSFSLIYMDFSKRKTFFVSVDLFSNFHFGSVSQLSNEFREALLLKFQFFHYEHGNEKLF